MALKHYSTKEILNMPYEEIAKITKGNKELLKDITTRVVNTANKRIERLEKSEFGVYSPAYNQIKKSGKRFSAKTSDMNTLRNELAVATQFLKRKTSTISGYKKVRERMKEEFPSINTKYKEKRFWNLYRELEERNQILDKEHATGRNSERIQKLLHNTLSHSGWNSKSKDIIESMESKINYINKREQDTHTIVEPDEIPEYDDIDYDEYDYDDYDDDEEDY